MRWNIALKLEQGEEFVERPEEGGRFGLMSMHMPVLTNRRALFRFNSLNTNMVQSFDYGEITGAQVVSRLLIKYLKISIKEKDFFFNIDEPEAWAKKIIESKERFSSDGHAASAVRKPTPAELLFMLETLKEAGLLTPEELEEKRRIILK